MTKKSISVLSWETALKLFPKKNPNEEFSKLITEICNQNQLKKSKKNYVYHTQFEFGEKLIDKGTISLDQFSVVHDTHFKKTNANLKEDLDYSEDPLGMVLKNHIEIYSENRSIGSKSADVYTVPLNIISEGELFGVFGALDHLIFCSDKKTKKNIHSKKASRDWYAIAGNICFKIAFPFENDTDSDFIDETFRNKFLESQDKLEFVGEHKIAFVREHIYSVDKADTENQNDKKSWKVDIIYFPKHFFELKDQKLKKDLENSLLKVGWIQSSPLRYALFENKVISDILYRPTTRNLKHNKHFLNILYDYINKAGVGKVFVLKPLLTEHILNEALSNFKEKYKDYFAKSRHFEPLIFMYGKIESKSDWGLLSIYHLPILLNYEIDSLNKLLSDLVSLNNKIQSDSKNQHKADYKLPELIAYGNTGGKKGSKVKVEKPEKLKTEFLSIKFKIEAKKINLTSKEFSNLILIKGK